MKSHGESYSASEWLLALTNRCPLAIITSESTLNYAISLGFATTSLAGGRELSVQQFNTIANFYDSWNQSLVKISRPITLQ